MKKTFSSKDKDTFYKLVISKKDKTILGIHIISDDAAELIQLLAVNVVAGNTLDKVLFQRAINFLGSWKLQDYTVEIDAMVDGNRRIKSTIGVINQRYIFALVGNANRLEVFSNYDRFHRSVNFPIEANKWYRLKTQVDIQDNGSGLLLAKVWPRDDNEPEDDSVKEIPEKDYNSMDMPTLVKELRYLMQEFPINSFRTQAEDIKKAFETADADAKKEALEKFTEENPPSDDALAPQFEYKNAHATEFYDLHSLYRKQKGQFQRDKRKQQEENLAKRRDIIEGIKQLINQEENTIEFETLFIDWVRTAFQAKTNKKSINKLMAWSEAVAKLGREME